MLSYKNNRPSKKLPLENPSVNREGHQRLGPTDDLGSRNHDNPLENRQATAAHPARDHPYRLMTDRQMAATYSIARGTIQQMRVRGNGPRFIKRGRSVLYRATDIEAWLDANTRGSTSDRRKSTDNSQPTAPAHPEIRTQMTETK